MMTPPGDLPHTVRTLRRVLTALDSAAFACRTTYPEPAEAAMQPLRPALANAAQLLYEALQAIESLPEYQQARRELLP